MKGVDMTTAAKPSAFIAVVTVCALLFQFGACSLSTKPQKIPVTSNPMGAKINVDGQDKGTTPLSLYLKRANDHRIRIEKTGYNPVDILLVSKSRSAGQKVAHVGVGLLLIASIVIIGGLIGDEIDSQDGESCQMEGLQNGMLIGAVAGTTLVLLASSRLSNAWLMPAVINVTLEKTQEQAQARTNVVVLDRDQLKDIRWIRISCAEGGAAEVVAVN
jgi:hypothetical protein